YMYSLNSTADGVMRLIVDYDVKTNPNTDLILTQIRETQAASQLPSDVTNFGVTVQKTVTAPLMLVTLYSPNGTYDARFLANYAYSVRAQGRLSSPEEFGGIVVRESPGGAVVRLKDVARVELGAQNYSVVGRLNGKPGAIIAVYQLPGSNAVEAANGVRKLFADVKTRLPSDMDYVLSLDTTRAVTQGMKEIVLTLVI